MKLTIAFLCLLLLSSMLFAASDARVVPGANFRIEFSDLPKTANGDKPASINISLPKNYDEKKMYGLNLFLDGGAGGKGKALLSVVKDLNYISVGFPLFHKGERKGGPMLPEDAEISWASYEVMLRKIYEIIPNIDPHISVAGGFSNGAQIIAILLDKKMAQWYVYFSAFYFVEGGYLTNDFLSVEKYHRPLFMLHGEKSPKNERMAKIADNARRAGVVCKNMMMLKTGHSFNKDYVPNLTEWIKNDVILASAPKRFAYAKAMILQKKYVQGMRGLNTLMAEDIQGELKKKIDKLYKKTQARSVKEWASKKKKYKKGNDSKYIKTVRHFLKTWQGTQGGEAAAEFLAKLNLHEGRDEVRK